LKSYRQNKRKIINDPVHGFISLPDDIIFDLIEHPHFQRLRRISQLGLTHLIYPGALHTRFHHAIGAMHLMSEALDVLQNKGVAISRDEKLATLIAILLHDIGHGPYSHTLENELIKGVSHEKISLIFMQLFRQQFGEIMDMAAAVFSGKYPRQFLHQLVSGQLDMDRLDYLKRDSFFTGVSEGVINTDRIIKMLDVVDDELVVEAKGIYSIEKFIVARRLMYWQVYLHKTVIAAEHQLINIIRRARHLALNGKTIFTGKALKPFLYGNYSIHDFSNDPEVIRFFSLLDDTDIFCAIKEWAFSGDKVLSMLCSQLINRQLFRTIIRNQPFSAETITGISNRIASEMELSKEDAAYFLITDIASNSAYGPRDGQINILFKNGRIKDYSLVADQINPALLSKAVTRYFICFPKQVNVPAELE
jgi:HD superfamily phosphohydrolase